MSVQAGPDREAVYAIGYGIPIGNAATIWPPEPKEKETQADEGAPGKEPGKGAPANTESGEDDSSNR